MSVIQQLAELEYLAIEGFHTNPIVDPEEAKRYSTRLHRHLERISLEYKRRALYKNVQELLYVQTAFGISQVIEGSILMAIGFYCRASTLIMAGCIVNLFGIIWTVCQMLASVGLRHWQRYYLLGSLIMDGICLMCFVLGGLFIALRYSQFISALQKIIPFGPSFHPFMAFLFLLLLGVGATLSFFSLKLLMQQYKDMAMSPPMPPPSLAPVA